MSEDQDGGDEGTMTAAIAEEMKNKANEYFRGNSTTALSWGWLLNLHPCTSKVRWGNFGNGVTSEI